MEDKLFKKVDINTTNKNQGVVIWINFLMNESQGWNDDMHY